jgi:mercuric ion binding protein
MKKALIALSAVVALGMAVTLTQGFTQTASADTDAAQAIGQTQSFAVEKMTCATCPISVKKAMSRVDGVYSISVDYGAKTAVAVFDPAKTSAQAIADASTDVGYPATPISD